MPSKTTEFVTEHSGIWRLKSSAHNRAKDTQRINAETAFKEDQKDQHHRHEGGRANTTPWITDISFDNNVRVVRAQQETIIILLAQTITQMMVLRGVSKEPGSASSFESIVSCWHNSL